MKSTGIVRKVDELGRLVLPSEIRRHMGINEGDAMEIYTDESRVILQKYQPACIFCNGADGIVYFNGSRICSACIEKLKAEF
ncbi:MAG: AbrB/MazE/SpoVT family DNA-binding domain-containing protein [Clostridia bacterium]|nr:AbrB/MazE/SpoVT family DNA-binding domain-containing protein [Clostridia bacterium]MBQ9807174.1 AbrB/MazE/SpoVT family DNA-binding domain-containing protein [Clostridia bacterium]